MLTKDQQKVIDSLVKKFDELNETKNDIPFSVLNINKFNSELLRVKKVKEELLIHNTGMQKLRNEYESDLIFKLNSDFKIGSLPLVAEMQNNFISINSKLGTRSVQMNVLIHVKPVVASTEFGNKITGFVYTDGYLVDKIEYKTPQKLLSSPAIQKKLIKIVEGTQLIEQAKSERLR